MEAAGFDNHWFSNNLNRLLLFSLATIVPNAVSVFLNPLRFPPVDEQTCDVTQIFQAFSVQGLESAVANFQLAALIT